jgi:hypothetical protein
MSEKRAKSGNQARVGRYRVTHKRIDYVPSHDVLPIMEHHLNIGTDCCVARVSHYRKWGGMMGRRRGFLPPATRKICGHPPALGHSLWPHEGWICTACLEAQSQGKDTISKAMYQTIEHKQEMESARRLEADGCTDAGMQCPNHAQWAGIKSAELNEQGKARIERVTIANGEALPLPNESLLHDTLSVPDLAAVEASLERSRLLLHYGTDVAAMALDTASSIKATNSLEKMFGAPVGHGPQNCHGADWARA